jgi:hypothetical protein
MSMRLSGTGERVGLGATLAFAAAFATACGETASSVPDTAASDLASDPAASPYIAQPTESAPLDLAQSRAVIVAGQSCRIIRAVDEGPEGLTLDNGEPDPRDKSTINLTLQIGRTAEAAAIEDEHRQDETILTSETYDVGPRGTPGDRNSLTAVDWLWPTSPYTADRSKPERTLLVRPSAATPAGTTLVLSMTVRTISPGEGGGARLASIQDCVGSLVAVASGNGITWELNENPPGDTVAPRVCTDKRPVELAEGQRPNYGATVPC